MGPLVPYFGGKNRLAKKIIERIPPHTCYVEVFAGGAGVLFRKDPSRAEILNDLDLEIITLYRVVKHHPRELHRQFENVLFSRDEFNRLQQIPPETLTDVQRAAKYFYLQRSAFGGRIVGQTFGTSRTSGPKLNLFNLQQKLHETWQRLAMVTIECLDFRDLIRKYDSPETYFFMDPPYWQLPGYRSDFVKQDFLDLAKLMKGIKGKCLMTINDTPEIRKIFKDFQIDEVELKYSMSPKSGSRAKKRIELFISN